MAGPSGVTVDSGGYMVQDMPAAAPIPAQVVVVNPPDFPGNPWAQPTAYRPSTDQYIGPYPVPAVTAAQSSPSVSQYAPAQVTPAGTPQYAHGPVVSPTRVGG